MEITSHIVHFEGHSALMAIAQDVTERCETEKALRQSEQRLALHIQQTPLAVIELEPDMTVTNWNPAAERTFGYTAAEAIGRNVAALIVPEEAWDHVRRPATLSSSALVEHAAQTTTEPKRAKLFCANGTTRP